MNEITPSEFALQILAFKAEMEQKYQQLGKRIAALETLTGVKVTDTVPSQTPKQLGKRLRTVQENLDNRISSVPGPTVITNLFPAPRNPVTTDVPNTNPNEVKTRVIDHNQIFCQEGSQGIFFTTYTQKSRTKPEEAFTISLHQLPELSRLKADNMNAVTISVCRNCDDLTGTNFDIIDPLFTLYVALRLEAPERKNANKKLMESILHDTIDRLSHFSVCFESKDRRVEYRNLNFYSFQILTCYLKHTYCDVLTSIPKEHLNLLLEPTIRIEGTSVEYFIPLDRYIFLCVHPKILVSEQNVTLPLELASFIIPAMFEGYNNLPPASNFGFITLNDFYTALKILKDKGFPLNFRKGWEVTEAKDLIGTYKLLHPVSEPPLTLEFDETNLQEEEFYTSKTMDLPYLGLLPIDLPPKTRFIFGGQNGLT